MQPIDSTARQLYVAAHEAHYTKRDLSEALELYATIMAEHGATREAGYSRAQVQNIVNSVVSKDDLLSLQVDAARSRLAADTASGLESELLERAKTGQVPMVRQTTS